MELRVRACGPKRYYVNRKIAKRAAAKIRVKDVYSEKGRITAYRCTACDGYHIGHNTRGYEFDPYL